MISRVMTALNYDSKKFGANLQEHLVSVGSEHDQKSREEILQAEIARTTRIDSFLNKNHLKTNSRQQRFKILSSIEEQRNKKAASGGDPMYGLDARKDPARLRLSAAPTLSWLNPPLSLWRTMRFEEKRESCVARHYTVHILVNPIRGIRFEIIVRIGTQACLGDISSQHVIFPTISLAEVFVEHFKQQMSLEGNPCVADVSNPNAIGPVMREGMPPVSMAATSYAPIPSQAVGGMFMPAGRAVPFGSPQRPPPHKRPVPSNVNIEPNQRPRMP